jgi:hypothetical protein
MHNEAASSAGEHNQRLVGAYKRTCGAKQAQGISMDCPALTAYSCEGIICLTAVSSF